MNGIHDMGGMHGYGELDLSDHPPQTWELRVAAMMYASVAAKVLNLDAFRFAIEQMPPTSYLESAYFDRWLTSAEVNHLKQGTFSATELSERQALYGKDSEAVMPVISGSAGKVRMGNWPYFRQHPDVPPPPATTAESRQPRFSTGDSVIVTNIHPVGHTRRPRYVRGKRGVVIRVQGLETFADTNAEYQGVQKEFVYNVEFDGRELWGDSAEPNQVVSIDLWENYLESD